VLSEALAVVRAIGDERVRAEALEALAARLPERLLDEALLAVGTIENEWVRAEALGALTGQLPESRLGDALSAARAIGDEEARAWVLGKLTARLPACLLGEALMMVQTLYSYSGSIEALSHISLRWTSMCRANNLSELGELSATLRTFAAVGREQLLSALKALLPVVESHGGLQSVRETAHAIMETVKWWL
jgi:hypothetical protein